MTSGARSPDHAVRFSRAAATYDLHAEVQGRAASHLLGLLREAPEPAFVLEIGCGTGLFTRLLRRRWPGTQICAIDVAEGMVRAAGAALAGDPRLQFRVAAAESFDAGRPVDVVAGNCSLQWLRPFAQGLRHLAAQLAPGGRLACSLMLEGTLGELHEARLAAAPAKPPLGRLPTAQEARAAVAAAGLALDHAEEEDVVTTSESVTALLRLLRKQGLTGGDVSRAATPLTRAELASVRAAYAVRHAGADGRVPATYRMGYYLASRR